MNKFLKYILIFFLALLPLSLNAKLPPSISTGGNSLNIIFAVDVSGSMSIGGASAPNYLIVGSVSGNTLSVLNASYCTTLSSKVGYYIFDPTNTINTIARGSGVTVTSYTKLTTSSCKATLSRSQNISNRTFYLSTSEATPVARYVSVQNAVGKIISDKSLASQANFALLTWGSSTATTVGSCRQNYTYTWVPLNSNKTSNYSEIQNGIQCINANGGGTQVDAPMRFIQNYVASSSFSAFDSCATTIVIVMSDGAWGGGSTAETIATALKNRSRSIKTYAVAIDIDPATSTFRSLANAGGTLSSPGVLGGASVNASSLVDAFKAAIQSALFDSYSAVAPTIMQKTSTDALILVPDFQYKATTQWVGHLTASKINTDGTINATPAWEFGSILSATSASSRSIWTAAPGVPTNISSTPNNFTLSNLTNLSSAIGVTSSTGAQLINFMRGIDAFDETANGSYTDERWKLNDIYNSKPLYVAQPEQTITSDANFPGGKQYFYKLNPAAYESYKSKVSTRKAMIYVGSNGGLLHAIEADTGTERWAFIPPPLLDKLDGVISSTLSNATNSIYGVDGTSVAQDVYINGEWKTYLAVTLGMGARGFSVLDITNPLIPKHVFSIERYEDINGVEHTRWWQSDGTLVTNSDLDNIYQTLGFTTSTPVFSYAKSHNNTYSPVLILGQGTSNSGLTNIKIWLGPTPTYSSVGSGALIIGLVPGSEGMLVANKDVGYTSTGNSTNASTSIVSLQATSTISNSFTIQVSNTYSLDEGASVTGSGVPANTVVESIDTPNQVTLSNRVSISNGSTLTFTRRIFNEVVAQVDALESGATPFMQKKYGYRMLVPNNNGYIHSFDDTGSDASTITFPYSTFSSTGSFGAYGAFTTMNSGTTFNNDRLIQQPLSLSNYVANPAHQLNIAYGTGDMETLSMIDKTPINVSYPGIDNLIVSIQDTENNIFGLNKSRSFLTTNSSSWGSGSLFNDATNIFSPTCQNSSQQGWYVRMNGLTAADENNVLRSCNYAKLAAKIETYGGMVAAPIYIPPADLNSCALGNSALIYRDAKCGYQSAPPLYLSSMLIGGITTYKNNIYISVSSKSAVTKVDAANKYSKVGAVITGQPGFTFKPATLKSKLRIR